MKNLNFKQLLLLFISIGIVATSCKKDEEPEPTPETPANPAAPTTPSINGSDAAHWAVNTFSTQEVPVVGTVEITIGLGVAAYFSEAGGSTLVDAGTVKVDGAELTRYENNSYALVPGTANPTGVDFDNMVSWEITGGNGFDAFTHTDNSVWPTLADITSSTTVSKSGYTMNISGLANADSVLFIIGDASKTLGGNATSCTFTAAELESTGTGASVMIAAAYRYNSTTINGKNMHFGKEAVRTKSITITE
jgi:hypothetical protein